MAATATALAASFLATGALAPGSAAEPPGAAGRPAFCDGRAVIPAQALEHGHAQARCDITGRSVEAAGISVEVPGADEEVTAWGLTDEGGEGVELTVRHSGGIVTASGTFNGKHAAVEAPAAGHDLPSAGEGSDAGAAPAGADQACDQLASAYLDRKERDTFQWRFNIGTTPTYIAQANAEFAIASGANWITSGYNDCGIATNTYNARHAYNGTTTYLANIGQTGCTSRDNRNVASFGDLGANPNGGSYLGIACGWTALDAWGYANELSEADIKFDNSSRSWFTSVPSSCSGKYDVASVSVHEFGHVFGLGHVAESSYPYMTMSTQSQSCSTHARTLGRGDYNGLYNRYR